MKEITNKERASWMGVLARADEDQLMNLTKTINLPDFDVLRGPEQGLVMVRGAAGGSGQKFNLGEMTVTRCTVRTEAGAIGHSYVAGRADGKAEVAAILDAMMQDSATKEHVANAVIAPLANAEIERRQALEKKSAATKVDFMTMVRGE